jgi:NAD(P)H-hydrate epimerase
MIHWEPGEPLTCQQMRELDVLAIEHLGIPGIILMENAARAVTEFVYSILVRPHSERVVVLCGAGNNGGDGFAVARQLHNAGVDVSVVLGSPAERLSGDASVNCAIFQRMEGTVIGPEVSLDLLQTRIQTAEVLIDALLGTGASGPPRGRSAELIDLANAALRARRVAIDLPSGLDADRGVVHEPCFRADATITFVAEKTGFSSAAARQVLGRVVVADIGIPQKLIPGREKSAVRG